MRNPLGESVTQTEEFLRSILEKVGGPRDARRADHFMVNIYRGAPNEMCTSAVIRSLFTSLMNIYDVSVDNISPACRSHFYTRRSEGITISRVALLTVLLRDMPSDPGSNRRNALGAEY